MAELMLQAEQCDRLRYVDLARIRRMVDEGPFDAIVCTSPENVPYFSGFYNMDLRILPERRHLVVWAKGSEPALVVMSRRAEQLTPKDTFVSDVRGYEGEDLDSMRILAEVLRERVGIPGTVGYEGRSFPGGHLLDLRERVPELRFVDAYDFFELVRARKTPAERETIIKVNRLTAEAIDFAFRSAKSGDTEREIAARMQYEILLRGADMINAPLLAAGTRTGMWHALPTDQRVEPGMLVKTDSGGFLDGYFSDIARTAVMGRATATQRDVHARCTEIKDRVVAAMKPGIQASELAAIGRKAYDDLNLEFKWSIFGHGIGLGLHEAPQIYPWVKEPLEEGMMMMVEVGYTELGHDSFHVEDLVEITSTGAEYRTDNTSQARILEMGV